MKFLRSKIQINKLFLLLLLLFTFACKEEQIILKSPSIEIKSTLSSALTTYIIEVDIKVGERQIIQKAEVVFKDITVSGAANIIKEIEIKGNQDQICTLIVNTNHVAHDYLVQAYLYTDKYTYTSEQKIIRSEKNRFIVDIKPNYYYADIEDNIAEYINIGGTFYIGITSLKKFLPKSLEVRLNRTLLLNHKLYNDSEMLLAASVPDDVEPGVYEVYVYLDGVEFKSQKNIKVLKGSWEKFDPVYPGAKLDRFAWTIKEDNLFIFGGVVSTKLPVWKYNIVNNAWEKRRDFKEKIDPAYCQIQPFNLQYNNKAYIIYRNDKIVEVWKYHDDYDEWSLVTTYPGKSTHYQTCFIVNQKLFLGGGFDRLFPYSSGNKSDACNDFWELDLETEEWTRKADIPVKLLQIEQIGNSAGTLSYSFGQNGSYVFSYSTNELWFYESETDKWIQKSKFPGHIRYVSNLVGKSDKLYLIGGSYLNYGWVALKDCWEYSVSTDSWETVAFMPDLYSNGIAFTYNNIIYAGLGEIISGYISYYENNFFLLKI